MPRGKKKVRLIRLGESYNSLLLGIVLVAVVLLLGILFFGNRRQKPAILDKAASTSRMQEEKEQSQKNPRKTYTVEEGDTLWSISEREYKSGFNWVDIAKANDLQNPDAIDIGQHITLPRIETKTLSTSAGPEMKTEPPQNQNAITESAYTVQKGDYLWNIALRAYGDGYRWADIARANNLANPNLIHSGNFFAIPR